MFCQLKEYREGSRDEARKSRGSYFRYLDMYNKVIIAQVADWSFERRIELQFAHLHSPPELYLQLATCYPCRSCCSRIEEVFHLCKTHNIPIEEEYRGSSVYIKFILEDQEKLGLLTFTPSEIAQFITDLIGLPVVATTKTFQQETVKPEKNGDDLRLWSKVRWLEKVKEVQTRLSFENNNLFEKYAGNLQVLLAVVILACGDASLAVEEIRTFDALSQSERTLSYNQKRIVEDTLGEVNPELNSYLEYKACPKITVLWVRKAMRESGLWNDQ